MRVVAILVLAVTSLLSLPLGGVHAQVATPGAVDDTLVGTWILQELLPPNGGPPVTAGVVTLFADGNALLSGFGDGQPELQGAWSATGEGQATLTVVGLMIDQNGLSDGTMQKLRAVLEVNSSGNALEGGYTFEVIDPDGDVDFTYHGPLGGTRVEVEPPDPTALTLHPATPAAGTPEP